MVMTVVMAMVVVVVVMVVGLVWKTGRKTSHSDRFSSYSFLLLDLL